MPVLRASEREDRRRGLLHAQECEAVVFGKPRRWKSGLQLQGRPELVRRLKSRTREQKRPEGRPYSCDSVERCSSKGLHRDGWADRSCERDSDGARFQFLVPDSSLVGDGPDTRPHAKGASGPVGEGRLPRGSRALGSGEGREADYKARWADDKLVSPTWVGTGNCAGG